MGMRRPWNLVNCPVYSLATYEEGKVNMNICTYVTAVSMKPKLYTIAVYQNTKTLDNLNKSQYAVLQLLRSPHAELIRLLGKTSGQKVNKAQKLEEKNWLINWKGWPVLKEAAAHLLLEKQHLQITGDHHSFLFSVKTYSTKNDQDLLMFQDLIDQKIIL